MELTRRRFFQLLAAIAAVASGATRAMARQTHPLWVNSSAKPGGTGKLESPFKTLGEAVSRVQPGGIIYVMPGHTENTNVSG